MNALINGEVDFFEQPANDLMPLLEANDGLTVEINDPLGNIGFARFNHLLPPFDKAEVRRAAIMAMKQEDYMTGAVGDPKFWRTCYSVYPCGTPLENDKGSEVMATGDVEKAKAALEAAGYDGTPVVIMQPTDIPLLSSFSLITAEKLRNAGFKVEVQAMDWSTLTSRRAKRDPAGPATKSLKLRARHSPTQPRPRKRKLRRKRFRSGCGPSAPRGTLASSSCPWPTARTSRA